MKGTRVYQVEEVVRRSVARQLLLELPDIAPYTTITRVEASADLRHATVWVGVVGGQDGDQVVARLVGVAGAFQQAAAGSLATKMTPRLHFRLDTNAQYAEDIDRLLKQT